MRREVTADWLRKNAVIERAGKRADGSIHSSGHVDCIHCGGYVGNTNEIGRVIGVAPGTLSKWLRRLPVRQEIASRIRASFFRVGE